MPEPSHDLPRADDRERHRAEIIERLYDVALDPIRLEALLDVWEGHAAPLRRGVAHDTNAADPVHHDPELASHVARALVFLERYDASRTEGGLEALLQEVPRSAAFITDGGATVLACNRASQVAFGIAEGGPVSALPFEPEDRETLLDAVRKVASGRAEKAMTLRILSLQSGSSVILRLRAVDADDRPAVLVISSEVVWPDGFEAVVQDAFGLTLAEVEIVRALTMGRPLREIAEARDRSIETVRTQLRSILTKTETHSQPELVRVVLGLMDLALVRSAQPAAGRGSVAQRLPERPVAAICGPDGRRLEWIEFGDPSGLVCLYMHLDYGFMRWPASAERAAFEIGMRVIVPFRAGFAGSDPLPRHSDRLDRVAADYFAVLDHLQIDRAVVLTLGADLRYALRMAQMRPQGLVAGIVGCAPQLPQQSHEHYERMDKWQRFIMANARYAPKILPFLVKAGFSLVRRLGPESFFRTVNGGSQADMEAFQRPEIRDAILTGAQSLLAGLHSGAETFSAEVLSGECDWSDLLVAPMAPVLLMQGDQDPQSPLKTTEEMVALFPVLRLEVLPGNGQLLFFNAWRAVLREVIAMHVDTVKVERA